MARALNPTENFEYVLEEQRHLPPGEWTVFELKVLTARELAKVEDSFAALQGDTGEVLIKSGSQVLKILELGLRGWDNLKDESGAEVPFRWRVPNTQIHHENLDRLYPAWRRELANAITEINRFDEEAAKNYGSSSQSP